MSDHLKKIALVTGANRGIGFEVSRQLAKKGLKVILSSRSEEKGKTAADLLTSEGLDILYHPLDVTSQSSVDQIFRFISESFGRLDVLINNAGALLDASRHPPDAIAASIFVTDIDVMRQSMEINTYGPIRLIQKFVPLMKKHSYGRIVNLSSGMGQLSEMNGGWPGYRLSKTALNAVTRIAADELQGIDILINSVCPGWVKTAMGGPEAELSTEEAADTIVWLATLMEPKSGGFYREREQIGW